MENHKLEKAVVVINGGFPQRSLRLNTLSFVKVGREDISACRDREDILCDIPPEVALQGGNK